MKNILVTIFSCILILTFSCSKSELLQAEKSKYEMYSIKTLSKEDGKLFDDFMTKAEKAYNINNLQKRYPEIKDLRLGHILEVDASPVRNVSSQPENWDDYYLFIGVNKNDPDHVMAGKVMEKNGNLENGFNTFGMESILKIIPQEEASKALSKKLGISQPKIRIQNAVILPPIGEVFYPIWPASSWFWYLEYSDSSIDQIKSDSMKYDAFVITPYVYYENKEEMSQFLSNQKRNESDYELNFSAPTGHTIMKRVYGIKFNSDKRSLALKSDYIIEEISF